MKKVNALILGLAVLLAFGCGGDEPEPNKIKKECTIIKREVQYTNNFGQQIGEVNDVTLNSTGAIEEVNYKTFLSNSPGSTIIHYRIAHLYNASGQLISKKSYFLPDNKLLDYYEYEYNSNNLITKIKGYHILGSDTIQGVNDSLVYYSDNRIKRYYYDPTYYYDFSYPSSNQVNKTTVIFDSTTNQEFIQEISEIILDSKRSPKANAFLYPYPERSNQDFGSNIASIKTTNNVLGTVITVNYSYQYNSDDYPISWTTTSSNSSNITTGTYDYNCQ